MINPWVILAFVLAVIGAYFTGEVRGDDRGAGRVQQAWDRSDNELMQMRVKRVENNRKTERALQAKADNEREATDAEKKRLAAERDAALLQLRNRPTRPGQLGPGQLPPAADTATEVRGCTGAELYRDDAEFLTRKAHTAQLIRIDRDACYRLYNEAREKLNAMPP